MRDPQGEAARWLAQAEEDLETVRVLLGAGRWAAACFHAQQAAEKAAKALRYRQGERFVIGHGAAGILEEAGVEESAILDRAKVLDQYYISTRYPNALPSGIPEGRYTEGQARRALSDAEEIVRAMRERST